MSEIAAMFFVMLAGFWWVSMLMDKQKSEFEQKLADMHDYVNGIADKLADSIPDEKSSKG